VGGEGRNTGSCCLSIRAELRVFLLFSTENENRPGRLWLEDLEIGEKNGKSKKSKGKQKGNIRRKEIFTRSSNVIRKFG